MSNTIADNLSVDSDLVAQKINVKSGGISHLLFIAMTALVVGMGSYLRVGGGFIFLSYIGLCLVYLFSNKFVYVKPLLVMTVVGLLYIGASYGDVLPDAWTRFYDQGAIIRQSVFVFSLYPVFCAFLVLWFYSIKSGSEILYSRILLYAVVPLFALSSYLHRGEATLPSGETEYLTVLWNAVAVCLFCASALAIDKAGSRFLKILMLVAVVILLSSRFQLVLAMVGILFLSLLPRPRLQLLILVPVAFAASLAFIPYAPEISLLDVNTGVRLFFWKDALAALVDTYGAGVGFGKEAVVNFYQSHIKTVVFNEEDASAQNFMLIGTHNSFYGMFFRLGIVGGLAFLVFFFSFCFPAKVACQTRQRKMCIAFYLAFLCCFVNVAIESPLFQIGVLCLLGYVAACNKAFAKLSTATA